MSANAPRSNQFPTPKNKPRKRIRLTRVDSSRGANEGAPPASSINSYPFPFQGIYAPARHGHHRPFPVGIARRVGAWRGSVGLGVPKGKSRS